MNNTSYQATALSKLLMLFSALLVTLLAGCASAPANAPAQMKSGMLVNDKGMTLYTYDNDKEGTGKSVCNGTCAVNWPPMMAQSSDKSTGDFTVITRDDGQKQWAFKGKPLYTWPEDQEPGDKYGDGYRKVWRIIK